MFFFLLVFYLFFRIVLCKNTSIILSLFLYVFTSSAIKKTLDFILFFYVFCSVVAVQQIVIPSCFDD